MISALQISRLLLADILQISSILPYILYLYLYWTIWKRSFRGEEEGKDHGEDDPIKENVVSQDELFF